MLSIILDPSYTKGIWCRQLLTLLTIQLKQKHLSYVVAEDVDRAAEGTKYAFIIGSNPYWMKHSISLCAEKGIHPILLSKKTYIPTDNALYSEVTSNPTESLKDVSIALKAIGKSSPALYGVNKLSYSDMSTLKSFISAVGEEGYNQVFYNDGNFDKCYCDFARSEYRPDSVICVNDFAAISLIRHLKNNAPERLKDLAIVCNRDTQITSLYDKDLIAVEHSVNDYGRAAVMILETLEKNPYLSCIKTDLKWDCSSIFRKFEAVNQIVHESEPALSEATKTDIFYDDKELASMMMVENLLFESDETDRIIITELAEDTPYEVIAEKHYLTVNTVKYHVRKMLNLCGFTRKKELVRLLQTCIPTEKK